MASVRFFDDRGGAGIRRLFYLFILGLIIYTGFKVVPPYFKHRMMQYEVKSLAERGTYFKDDEIRKQILEKADYWSIPVAETDIEITRGLEAIEVSFFYDIELNFFNRYKKTLHFEVYEKKPLAEVPRF